MDIDSALQKALQAFEERHPASKAASVRAAQALPGGNNRHALFCNPFPVTLVRGEGSHVWDADGHQYVDALGEFTASITGHSHPAIKAAAVAALERGINLGGHIQQEAELSQAIKARFPSMQLMRFCNSGTEANMMNILTARAHTARNKVMVFEGSYHGGVFSFPCGKTMKTNAPFDFIVAPYNDARVAEQLIREHGPDLACVIFEAMLGTGGCIPANSDFVQAIRAATEQVGALMIMDEVMTSRLSPGGLQQRLGVTPDLTSLGKYVGGGMTFGAFGGRADVMNAYDPRNASGLMHSGTFNNNTLSMAAGAVTMTQVATPEAINALNAKSDALRQRLNSLSEQHGSILQWTGVGSMLTAHFHAGDINSAKDIQDTDPRLKELLYLHLLSCGVWTTTRCMFSPCLVMGDKDYGAIVDAVESFLRVHPGLGHANEP